MLPYYRQTRLHDWTPSLVAFQQGHQVCMADEYLYAHLQGQAFLEAK